MLQVAAFTGGTNVPSARYRVRQLIPHLLAAGVAVHEYISRQGTYPPPQKIRRPFWALNSLMHRVPAILHSYQHQVSWLQREFLSTFYTLEGLTKAPRVLDVDDAIWMNSARPFAAQLAQNCDLVVCGNDYLADYFSRWNKNIVILPTPVDTKRFFPGYSSDRPIIGWMGTHSNYKYLYQIESALRQVLDAHPHATLRIVSDQRPTFSLLQSTQVEYIDWTPEQEVHLMQAMTVGLMPLENSEWEKGKCSYKMLLYMACGIPVVVSPVGMNAQVLQYGNVGKSASTMSEWVTGISELISDQDTAANMGRCGRAVVCEHFSVDVIAPQLATSFRAISGQQ